MAEKQESDSVALWSRETEYLRTAYQNDPVFQERFRLWQRLLDAYGQPGMNAIDMGCGTGVFTLYLAGKGLNVVGVDGSAEMLAVCVAEQREQGLERAHFLQATLPDLPEGVLPKADLIISSSVLEYVSSLDETLDLFSGLLKKGGTLILSLPNKFSISRTYYRLKYKLRGSRRYMGTSSTIRRPLRLPPGWGRTASGCWRASTTPTAAGLHACVVGYTYPRF